MTRKKFVYDYPRPCVTVDIVLVSREAKPRVLLIRRKRAPFAGMWALPGGFIDMDESLEESARRELAEETGMKAGPLEQLSAFGDPKRDPRDRVISVAFLGRAAKSDMSAKAADDAAEAGWYPLRRLPELAFDHRKILTMVRRRLALRATKSSRGAR